MRRYPRKDSGSIRTALSLALTKASFDTILCGLESYPFSSITYYQPMASRWLNEERWTHAPPTAPQTSIIDASSRGWRMAFARLYGSARHPRNSVIEAGDD